MNIITVGILGGGQLARMSAYAAFRFGCRVAVFERAENSPAAQLTPMVLIAEWDDVGALRQFASLVDVITLENEFIDASILSRLESFGKPVFPSSRTVALIQDKFVQKTTLTKAGLPVAPFRSIVSAQDADTFGKTFGYPFVLKARKGGYDGYGNRTVQSAANISDAMTQLGFPNREIYAEAFVDFARELAVMVARNRLGELKTYPVVETIQENHICKIVKAPADVSASVRDTASTLAKVAVEYIDGVGVFGVELFEKTDGSVVINELAPRPHNSGHYTIEACATSQFENHIRAVLNYPLGNTEMIVPAAVMVNVLGKRNAPLSLDTLRDAVGCRNAKIHIYGKADSRIGRKLGHITVVGQTLDACLNEALLADSRLML